MPHGTTHGTAHGTPHVPIECGVLWFYWMMDLEQSRSKYIMDPVFNKWELMIVFVITQLVQSMTHERAHAHAVTHRHKHARARIQQTNSQTTTQAASNRKEKQKKKAEKKQKQKKHVEEQRKSGRKNQRKNRQKIVHAHQTTVLPKPGSQGAQAGRPNPKPTKLPPASRQQTPSE